MLIACVQCKNYGSKQIVGYAIKTQSDEEEEEDVDDEEFGPLDSPMTNKKHHGEAQSSSGVVEM